MGIRSSTSSKEHTSPQYKGELSSTIEFAIYNDWRAQVIQLNGDESTTDREINDTSTDITHPRVPVEERVAYSKPESSLDIGVDSPQLIWLHTYENGVVFETLSKEQRNEVVRNDPIGVMSSFQTATLKQIACQEGLYRNAGCLVSWKRSVLPFVLEFTITHHNVECRHLVSVRDRRARDPVCPTIHPSIYPIFALMSDSIRANTLNF